MKIFSRSSLTLLVIGMITFPLHAEKDKYQTFSPIHTAIPSLSIAPDARGGSMGDNGAATLPDINSQFWNASKYAFMESKAGVAISYTPWLRKLVRDVYMAHASGYYKPGQNDRSAIGASLRYFSLGAIPITDYGGKELMNINPYEMTFDLSYGMKLSDAYSMAVALRYIRSDLGADAEQDMQAANAVAVDVSGYMEKYVYLGESESLWSLGYNISNIGSKVSFNGGAKQYFLPANLKIGTGLLYPIDEYNQFGVYLDLNKYLVPSQPQKKDGETDEAYSQRMKDYNDMNSLSGVFKSFSDAPGGFNEEMKEINVSLGAEYSYNNLFFVRGGYYYENAMKGNRQYFSMGAGFKMNVFQLDAAYLISTVQNNPLDQTLRFSLSFDMDGLKSLFE